MTADDDNDQDSSDWLSRQFESPDELRRPRSPAPHLPVEPPVIGPSTPLLPSYPPPPGYLAPAYLPPALVPPTTAALPPATAQPPGLPTAAQFPVPPTAPLPFPPPAAQPAPAQPFSWGLTPGQPELPHPTPPSQQRAQSPVEPSGAPSAPPVAPPFAPPLIHPLGPPFVVPQLVTPAVPPTFRLPWETESGDPAATPELPTVVMPQPGLPTTALPLLRSSPAEPPPLRMPWDASPPIDPALDGATEVLGAQAVGLAAPAGEAAPTSALDSLFGDTQFREYEYGLVPNLPPRANTTEPQTRVVGRKDKPPRAPIPVTQRVLMSIAATLLALLLLVALFFLGTRLSGVLGAAPAISPSPTPSASPLPVVLPLGPVKPGVYSYSALLGGECLAPYTSPWEEKYTVVDCAIAHPAQLIHVGTFTDKATDPYPGVGELQKRINVLCTPTTIIDYALAGAIPDLQVAASYAANQAQWASGNRTFYCFVNRSGGSAITGTVAMPQVAPTVAKTAP